MALKLPEGNIEERLEGYLSGFNTKHSVDEGTVEKNAVKLVVAPEVVPAVLATAREELGVLHFAFLTVVDRVGSFEVNYELLDLRGGIIRIKTVIEGTEPVIGTATKAYPGANWHEREAYDMFGVAFRGHPDLRRTYMWQDHFDHHPLLKELEINTKRTFEGLR